MTKNNHQITSMESVFETIHEFSDTQRFKVLDFGFYENLSCDDEQAGYLELLNIVNGEQLSFAIWISDLEEQSFYICIPDEEDEDEYDVVNVEDLNIFYAMHQKTEFPIVDVVESNGGLCYQLKYPSKYRLTIGEGFTYMPLCYNIFTEADPSFDEVGEMTFLHTESNQEVTVPLYTTDFEDATLYVCLQDSECSDDEDVTFLIEFNDLRIPIHQHIQEQKNAISA